MPSSNSSTLAIQLAEIKFKKSPGKLPTWNQNSSKYKQVNYTSTKLTPVQNQQILNEIDVLYRPTNETISKITSFLQGFQNSVLDHFALSKSRNKNQYRINTHRRSEIFNRNAYNFHRCITQWTLIFNQNHRITFQTELLWWYSYGHRQKYIIMIVLSKTFVRPNSTLRISKSSSDIIQ